MFTKKFGSQTIHRFNNIGSLVFAESRKVDASSSSQPKPISPSLVLENLRHTMMEYKRKLNMTSEEVSKMLFRVYQYLTLSAPNDVHM
jgi:hypothetical protein